MFTFLRVVSCHIQVFPGASIFTKESDPMPKPVVQKLRVADPTGVTGLFKKGPDNSQNFAANLASSVGPWPLLLLLLCSTN